MTLQFKAKYVVKNIVNIDNDNIYDIYTNMFDVVDDNEKDVDIKRSGMIKYIRKNVFALDDEDVENLSKKIRNIITKNKKDNKMREIMLDVLNQILTILGDDSQLIDLTDFLVRRDQLISDTCKQIIADNESIIFNYFDKGTKYRDRKRIKYGHISIIKEMLKQIGYSLCTSNKSKMCHGEKTFYSVYFVKKT
jgi:hypothetical protein